MNLRLVHAVVILFSAALALLFGFWCLAQYGPVAAIASFAVSCGLVAYDSWFLRQTRTL